MRDGVNDVNKSVWGSIAAMVVIAVGVSFAAAGALRDDANQADDAAAPATSAPESALAAEPTAGSVAGVALPALQDGVEALDLGRGVAVINLWAWWCQPCRAEIPALVEVARERPEWTVAGVHADPNAESGRAFLAEIGADLPSFQDPDNRLAGTLGLPGVIPITLVLRDGEVVGQVIEAFEDPADIIAAVEARL